MTNVTVVAMQLHSVTFCIKEKGKCIFLDSYGSENVLILAGPYIYHYRAQKIQMKLVFLTKVEENLSDENEEILEEEICSFQPKIFTIRTSDGPPLAAVQLLLCDVDGGSVKIRFGSATKKRRKPGCYALPKYCVEIEIAMKECNKENNLKDLLFKNRRSFDVTHFSQEHENLLLDSMHSFLTT